jgi:excinuclease UvrABC nuclease subunit
MNVTAYTIEEMKALVRPCVYAFFRNGKVMYIGKSCNGILRPLSPKHHVRDGKRNRKYKINGLDTVVIFWFDKNVDAYDIEQHLISLLRPPHNGRVPNSRWSSQNDALLRDWFFNGVDAAKRAEGLVRQ